MESCIDQTIDLGNQVELGFRKTADGCCALNRVTVRDMALRSPRLPVQPLWATPGGLLFDRLAWQRTDETDNGYDVRFSCRGTVRMPFQEWFDCSRDWIINEDDWSGADRSADVVLRLRPLDLTVEGVAYTGFSMQWDFSCPGAAVHWGMERSSWELGGSMDRGNHLLARTLTSPPVTSLTREAAYTSYGPMVPGMPGQLWARGSMQPVFDMQCGADGTLIRYFPPAPLVRSAVSKGAGADCCKYLDLHLFELTDHAAGVPCWILFSPEPVTAPHALRNRWLQWQRHSQSDWCEATGIEAHKPVPTIYHTFWTNYHFEDYEPVVDIVSQLGFPRLMIHDSIWDSDAEQIERLDLQNETHGLSGKCNTWDWEVSEFRGGPAPLRKLKESAEQRGLDLWYWFACHLSLKSPLVKEHPEWLVKWKNLNLTDGGYDSLAPVDLNNREVYDRIVEKLTKARDSADQHGFFWDSVSNLAWWQVNYADPELRPQLPSFLQLVRQLQEAGLNFAMEALCVFAPSVIGYRDFYQRFRDGNECFAMDVMLRSTEYPAGFLTDGRWDHELYFRFLAHRSIPLLSFYSQRDLDAGLHPARQPDAQTGELVRHGTFPPPADQLDLVRHFDATFQSFNHAYMAALPDMDRLELLPDDKGVQWHSNEHPGRLIIWCFQDGSLPVSAGATVEDLRAGRNLPSADGSLAAKRFGVYRISPATANVAGRKTSPQSVKPNSTRLSTCKPA